MNAGIYRPAASHSLPRLTRRIKGSAPLLFGPLGCASWGTKEREGRAFACLVAKSAVICGTEAEPLPAFHARKAGSWGNQPAVRFAARGYWPKGRFRLL